MTGFLMRIGQILFVLGFTIYYFTHSVLFTSLLAGLGFIFFIIGLILSSLEAPGHISLS